MSSTNDSMQANELTTRQPNDDVLSAEKSMETGYSDAHCNVLQQEASKDGISDVKRACSFINNAVSSDDSKLDASLIAADNKETAETGSTDGENATLQLKPVETNLNATGKEANVINEEQQIEEQKADYDYETQHLVPCKDHIDSWHPISNTTVDIFPLPCQTSGRSTPLCTQSNAQQSAEGWRYACGRHTACSSIVSNPAPCYAQDNSAAAIAPTPIDPGHDVYSTAIFIPTVESTNEVARTLNVASPSTVGPSLTPRSVAISDVPSKAASKKPSGVLTRGPFGCCSMSRPRPASVNAPTPTFWKRWTSKMPATVPAAPESKSMPRRFCCAMRLTPRPDLDYPEEPMAVSSTPLTWVMVDDGRSTARSLPPVCSDVHSVCDVEVGQKVYPFDLKSTSAFQHAARRVGNTPRWAVYSPTSFTLPHHQEICEKTTNNPQAEATLYESSNSHREVTLETQQNDAALSLPRVLQEADATLLDFGPYSIRIHAQQQTASSSTPIKSSVRLSPAPVEKESFSTQTSPEFLPGQSRQRGLFGCCSQPKRLPTYSDDSKPLHPNQLLSSSSISSYRKTATFDHKHSLEGSVTCRPPHWVELVAAEK